MLVYVILFIVGIIFSFFIGAEFECMMWKKSIKNKKQAEDNIVYRANIKKGVLTYEYSFKAKRRVKEHLIDNGIDKGWVDVIELEELIEE